MNAIPLPVPPLPQSQWEGALLDVKELHLAYNRLPAEVQAAVAKGYRDCLQVLEYQNNVAYAALSARYRVFTAILEELHLSPEEMVPDLKGDPYLSLVEDEDEDEEQEAESDVDARVAELVRQTVQLFLVGDPAAADADVAADVAADTVSAAAAGVAADDGTVSATAPDVVAAADTPAAADRPVVTPIPSPSEDRAPRRFPWYTATVSLVAAASLGLLAWQQFSKSPAPTAQTFTIDQSAQAGDLTVILSHAEKINDITKLHVYMVNSGDEPQPAGLTVSERGAPASVNEGSDGQPTIVQGGALASVDEGSDGQPTMVPPRSTQHRTVEVRDGRGEKSVTIELKRPLDTTLDFSVTVP